VAQKFVTPVTIRNLTSASSDGLAVSVDGDTNDRIKVEAGGRLVWGSGSATGDANLYRSGVGAVKTDHTFEAESGVITLTSSGAPTSTIADGAIAVDTTNSKFYYRSNSAWNTISGGATVSTTAPSNPSEGDIWFDSNTGDTLVYYGSVWVDVGGSSVANIAVQTTAPSNPVNGDLWFDTDTAKTYVWYDDGTSAQWVEVGAASAAASGTDGAIQFASGGTFSSDASNLVWDDANNRLGIGTTTPDTDLHVYDATTNIVALFESGDSSAGIAFKDSDSTGNYYDRQIRVAGNDMHFQTGNTDRVTIDSSGNVGINDTTPSYKLDVNGDINSQTDVLVSGTSLPRGRLVHWSTTTDFTLSTSVVAYGSATFTLTESRHILAVLWYGELDSFSTNPINVYGYIYEPSINDQIITALVSYTGSGGVSSLGESRHLILPAGTYTWEFRGVTNTGTCRVDNASSVNRSTGYAVFDMGGA